MFFAEESQSKIFFQRKMLSLFNKGYLQKTLYAPVQWALIRSICNNNNIFFLDCALPNVSRHRKVHCYNEHFIHKLIIGFVRKGYVLFYIMLTFSVLYCVLLYQLIIVFTNNPILCFESQKLLHFHTLEIIQVAWFDNSCTLIVNKCIVVLIKCKKIKHVKTGN